MKALPALVALALLCACNKNDPAPLPSKIGETYQGGIVFYIDGTGKHGLIAATADQSSSATWWNGSFIETKATSTTDGKANTDKIVAALGSTGDYAARLCRQYKGGGYTDWYLPSSEELGKLFNQRTVVGGFSTHIYWSSTETELGMAWTQDFETGAKAVDNISDAANVSVRAIRSY